MGRIRILSDAVANKIAAGEVVERPASVVKELLENALDAGATDVRIEVENGGRRLIRIADDGCGLMRDDAMLAFERHATSKLADVKDLLHIATLGFRGEALPSIASVSRLVLETRTRDEAAGTVIEIAGGKLLRCEDAARAHGTTVTVRDLFFNVPARKKFLRTEQTELAHVASLVTHYSLAHHGKTFELRSGTNELLSVSPVETLKERVYQVFGSRTLEDLIDLGAREREMFLPEEPSAGEDVEPQSRAFLLRGFVSRPQVQKLNRNSIYLFVNGRLIRDRLLLHALSSAYHNLIPPSAYPFALLFLDCDAEEVDVNVHPSKTEVRFRHGSFVHDFVRDAIRETLIEQRPVSAIQRISAAFAPEGQPAGEVPMSEFSQALENGPFFDHPSIASGAPAAGSSLTLTRPPAPQPRLDFGGQSVYSEPQSFPGGAPPASVPRLPVPDTHGSFPEGSYDDTPSGMQALTDLRPLGQLHDSFIIAAGRDGLWIIDQHVAHERILFEQILAQQANGHAAMQQLLMPLIIELSAAQQIEYARIAGEFRASGFDTEPFGNRTIAVKAAPAGVGPGDIQQILFEILEIAETEFRRASLADLRRAIAASVACRAAIKINMRLEPRKIDWLLQALSKTECPMSCPHGRPVAIRYLTRNILRDFHRI